MNQLYQNNWWCVGAGTLINRYETDLISLGMQVPLVLDCYSFAVNFGDGEEEQSELIVDEQEEEGGDFIIAEEEKEKVTMCEPTL